MKIIKKKKSKKPLLIALLVIIVAAGGVFAFISDASPFSTSNSSKDAPKTTETSQQTTTPPASRPEDKQPTPSPDASTDQSTEAIPQSTKTSVTITRLDKMNGTVTYEATVNGTKNGTCDAIFTHPAGKPVNRVSKTTTGSCSATISESFFDAYGTWTLSLRFFNNNTKSEDTKTITLEPEG